MQMVPMGSATIACNAIAMLHLPGPNAMGGCVGFVSWKRCATSVDVSINGVAASCDAASYTIAPGDRLVLETAWVSDWTDPQTVWDAWPRLVATYMSARLPVGGRVPVGWLCWSWQDPTQPALSGATCAEELYLESAKALADQGYCEVCHAVVGAHCPGVGGCFCSMSGWCGFNIVCRHHAMCLVTLCSYPHCCRVRVCGWAFVCVSVCPPCTAWDGLFMVEHDVPWRRRRVCQPARAVDDGRSQATPSRSRLVGGSSQGARVQTWSRAVVCTLLDSQPTSVEGQVWPLLSPRRHRRAHCGGIQPVEILNP